MRAGERVRGLEREREDPDDESEWEPEEEESESDPESELGSESDSELDEDDALKQDESGELLLRGVVKERAHLFPLFPNFTFVDGSPGLSLARSFSFASSNLLAVPVLVVEMLIRTQRGLLRGLDAHFVLNSSGKSTEGFPSSFSLSSGLVFASCCVLEGRETYGRVDLHS